MDGFHPINLGNLFLGNNNGMIPCTPLGCIYMLKKELGSLNGLNATIVGRSNIVGKPMQSLLVKENCTTTITHSKTRNLSEFTLKADILIAAIGMTEFIDNSYVKDKATIIDVGLNRTALQFDLAGSHSEVGSAACLGVLGCIVAGPRIFIGGRVEQCIPDRSTVD